MEMLKTPYSQSNLEKGKQSWKNQVPSLQMILQSYNNQNDLVTKKKKKVYINGTGKEVLKQNHTSMLN